MPQRRPGKPDRQTSSVQASERLNKPSQRVRETIMTSKEAMAEEIRRLNEKIEALEMKQQLEYLMKRDVQSEARFKASQARFKALEDQVNALRGQPAAKKMPKQPAGPPPKNARAEAKAVEKAAMKPSNVTKIVVVKTPPARRTEPSL